MYKKIVLLTWKLRISSLWPNIDVNLPSVHAPPIKTKQTSFRNISELDDFKNKDYELDLQNKQNEPGYCTLISYGKMSWESSLHTSAH